MFPKIWKLPLIIFKPRKLSPILPVTYMSSLSLALFLSTILFENPIVVIEKEILLDFQFIPCYWDNIILKKGKIMDKNDIRLNQAKRKAVKDAWKAKLIADKPDPMPIFRSFYLLIKYAIFFK